jgi:glutamate N-acetyltransferase/amino-acid N-acetyltransferase
VNILNIIDGGITAPKGYAATGVSSGIKNNNSLDLSLIVSEKIATTAGVFTKNIVKGHSLKLTMEHIKNGKAKALLINSGNANACVGDSGYNDAVKIANYLSDKLDCTKEEIMYNSTGVIGVRLDSEKVCRGIDKCIDTLSIKGEETAAKAIMTTDTYPKKIAYEFVIDGKKAKIGGMAKGSGMIHPNMATMIGAITTDVSISQKLLKKVLTDVTNKTFNRISVDGDTSVCDMVLAMANGMSEVSINEDNINIFSEALENVCKHLSKNIVKDGEGATKLLEIEVKNANTESDAYLIAYSIARSPLVKTAFFGEDANWGRIITAAGYSGASFNPDSIDIFIGHLKVCDNGTALLFDEGEALKILKENEIKIVIDLKEGTYSDRMWTCDFSYDYVKINGSYRS